MMEYFWEYWYWGMLVVFFVYFYRILEKSVGIKSIRAIPIRYYPPKGLSVIQAGVLYDRFTETKDFSASVLELAMLGYLSIHKQKNKDILLTCTKKKSDALNEEQRYLLKKVLFRGLSKSYTLLGSASVPESKMLQDFDAISHRVSKWAVDEGYLVENPKKARRRFVWQTLLLFVVMAVMIYLSGMVSGFFAYIALFFIYIPLFFLTYSKSKAAKIIISIFPTVIILPIILNDEFRMVLFEELHLWLYIVIGIIIMAFRFTYEYVGTFTSKGLQARNWLSGFELFLKRVKKDEIQRRIEEDPHYLDKVLPYAVMYGISSHELDFDVLKDMAR